MPVPTEPRRSDKEAIDLAIRLGLLAFFCYIAFTLVSPFLSILLWAVTLTVAFYPIFEWLRARLGGRSWLAAILITVAAVAVVVGPIAVLLKSLVATFETLALRFRGGHEDLPQLPEAIVKLPVAGPWIGERWADASGNLKSIVESYGHYLIGAGEWTLRTAEGLAATFIVILGAVVLSGFLYAPAPRLVAEVRRFTARLVGARGSAFVDLVAMTVRTVARGVIGIATIQTVMIGLGLIVAGVPAAGLLTFACLLLAIVQIGTSPVVIPLLIWVWTAMEGATALLLTLWLGFWMLSDNLLRPVLLGKGLRTPMPVILAGVIGGTIAYGLVGLFVGPVVLAVFYDLFRFWTDGPSAAEELEAGGAASLGAAPATPSE